MVFFGVAIALAILLTPERRQFGQKWIWLTGLIAFVIALPNIIWQIERSWPTWVLLHGIAQSHKNVALTPEKLLAYMRAIHFEVPRTETSHTAALPQLYADQFGWEEMVRSVARVYASCPPEEQKRAAIFCQNYGEAGAIDFFGSKYGLPPALSGHQNYFYWGPDDYTGEIMIVLDDDATESANNLAR